MFVAQGKVARATLDGNSQCKLTCDQMITSRFGVTVTAFFTGRFLRETQPGGNVLYTAVNSTYRF